MIQINPELYRQAGVDPLLGSPEKTKSRLGPMQAVSFEHLVGIVVQEDSTRARGVVLPL